jgi:heptose-I-phosphate ethanolaminephosphotransferase
MIHDRFLPSAWRVLRSMPVRVRHFLWNWRWALLTNAFLLAPVAFYELEVDGGGHDKTLPFILLASVLGLLTAQAWTRRLWVSHVLLLPFYLVAATDLYVIQRYGTRLTSATLLVMIGNSSDAKDYWSSHFSSIAPLLFTVAAGYSVALVKMRHLRVDVPLAARFAPLCALLAVYGVVLRRAGGLPLIVAEQDRSSPFGIFAQGYLAFETHRQTAAATRSSAGFRFGARRIDSPRGPEAYVLVIGESSRPDHWGLYGYRRDTTPRLSRTPDIATFRDVVAQEALTNVSVPQILTRGTVEHPGAASREKSVVSAFAEAGFETYWASTQDQSPFTAAIKRYAAEAGTERYFARRHDGVLADFAAEVLSAPGHERVFVVLHTMGNHYTYESRYPEEFDVFGANDKTASARQRMVNAYDNAVRYSDLVISRVIEALQRRGGVAALFYVSDHGENLKDDERGLYGHFINNEFDLPVPMVFWWSKDFAERRPLQVAAATSNASEPISTRVMFHSLLDMASITVDDPAQSRLSVFADGLRDAPRLVFQASHIADYDCLFEGAEPGSGHRRGRDLPVPLSN